jgi:ketosteroid isomerase-like protein
MKTIRISCALTAIAIGAPAAGSQNDEAALQSLIGRLVAAQTSYDAVALDRLLTSDYTEVSPVGEVDPREKVLSFYQATNKPAADKMTASIAPSEFSIRQFDTVAVVITRLTTTMTVDGKSQPPRSLRATFVCRKVSSGWQIASAQYTGIRP